MNKLMPDDISETTREFADEQNVNRQFLWLFVALIAFFGFSYGKLLIGLETFSHDVLIWSGSFHYYVDSLTSGYLPLWDPYLLTGTPLYPDIHLLGLLDPLVLVLVFFVKFFHLSSMIAYTYFYLSRVIIFSVGAFFLYHYVTKCRVSAILAAGVLFFSLMPIACRQNGMINAAFLTPFALYFLLRIFEDIEKPQVYLYLSSLLIIVGITLNVYIPVYFFFNFVFFFLAVLLLKLVSFSNLLTLLRNIKFMAFSLVSMLLVIMMVAPAYVVYKNGESGGELFPSARIIQKNRGVYKKIPATEVDLSSLSGKFTKHKGVYSSYGNIASLIYPDLWKAYFQRKGVYRIGDYISEINQYIGIIPFILCIVGFLFSKTKYRYLALAMLVIITLNMISTYGVHDRPPNLIQRFFNGIFPPLKMIEVRENFGSFFLLYLCMMLSLGIKLFINKFTTISTPIIVVCGAVLLTKIVISQYFFQRLLYISKLDFAAVIMIIVFALIVFLYSRGFPVPRKAFYGMVVIMVFADLSFYTQGLKKEVLYENLVSSTLSELKGVKHFQGNFEYFRQPLLLGQWWRGLESYYNGDYIKSIQKAKGMLFMMAYTESILKVKGIFSKGNNHHPLTTKRYYELFTHVPVENQFFLSGVVYPIIRFYTPEQVKREDKKTILSYLINNKGPELGKYLLLEEDSHNQAQVAPPSFSGVEQYENARWLTKNLVMSTYQRFIMGNQEKIIAIRNNLESFLKTSDYTIEVTHFSANKLGLLIHNKKDGYLYYNDGWSKDWEAYDNEEEVPIFIANFNSKAVFLKKGTHALQFVFNPADYRFAVLGYYLGLVILICLIVFHFIKNRSPIPTSLESGAS